MKLYAQWGWSIAACLLASQAWAQAPTHNPYSAAYGARPGHWTDSLRWTTVVPVTLFGATPNDNQDDHAAITAGIDSLHRAGGGVLYFPAGLYNSSDNITLKTGVILRGDTLPATANDPKQTSYDPPSKIWFPRYVFDTLANNGTGTDNNTAFKLLQGDKTCSNAGVIDLDINRAVIKFQPEWVTVGAPHTNRQPLQRNRNIIVMGCRSNNAVLPDPVIPNANQKPWQRFYWRFSTNIDVNVWANAVVARNRLNDGVPADDFMMEGYVIEFRGTGGWRPLTLAQDPKFDYNAHYGISVNRKKTWKDATTERWQIDGYPTWASPEQEPTLFSPGIEILDNWMYKTNRVAIIAAGNGLVIKGNVCKDDATKPSRTSFIGVTGRLTPQGATTFENRGLDFSGWNVRIEDNDIEVYRHRAGGYLSTDGEGILLQECCGGTQVNDYVIRNNFMRTGNYIGIYKMRDINNIEISGNNLVGGPIWVWANTNGGQYYLNSSYVNNNTNVGGISMNGSLGGTLCTVYGNQGSGTINVPCHTDVANNSGFGTITYNTGGGAPCTPTTTFPQGQIVGPAADSSICNAVAEDVLIKIKVTSSDPSTATIDLMQGTTRIAQGLIPDPIDSMARYIVSIPPVNGEYQFTGVVRNGANSAFTRVRTIVRNCVVGLAPAQKQQAWVLYPNPAQGELLVHSDEIVNDRVSFEVRDMVGKLWHASSQFSTVQGFTHSINTESLPKGVYMLTLRSPQGRSVKRFVKE